MSDYPQTTQNGAAENRSLNADLRVAGNGASRTEKELDEVIEQMPTMAWVALADGSVGYVNRQWQEYTGLSTTESAGEGWRRSAHPEDIEPLLQTWRISLATGKAFEHEGRLRRAADGAYRWFLIRAAAVRNNTGKISKWHGLLIDIEDSKSAAEKRCGAEEWARKAGDAIPQQIWSGSGGGSLDYCNEQWRRYTGISLEELQGDGWQKMLHPDDRDRVIKAWREAVANGTPYEQEERNRSADGTYRWFLCRGLPCGTQKAASKGGTARTPTSKTSNRRSSGYAEARHISRRPRN